MDGVPRRWDRDMLLLVRHLVRHSRWNGSSWLGGERLTTRSVAVKGATELADIFKDALGRRPRAPIASSHKSGKDMVRQGYGQARKCGSLHHHRARAVGIRLMIRGRVSVGQARPGRHGGKAIHQLPWPTAASRTGCSVPPTEQPWRRTVTLARVARRYARKPESMETTPDKGADGAEGLGTIEHGTENVNSESGNLQSASTVI